MELSIEEKAKRYDEALEKGKQIQNTPYTAHLDIMKEVAEHLIPELKESEDERIRKELIAFLKENLETGRADKTWSMSGLERWIAWLEKQGEKKPALDIEIPFGANDSELKEATYFIPKGFHAEIIGDEVHIKQGEQKPVEKEFTFKAIPRLLDMIPSSEKAKSYCGKLSDTFDKEGYHADAKIVRESIKVMNGEKVAMATMDEEKPTIVGIMKNYFATTPKEQQDKDWEELKHLNNFGWELLEQNPAWSEEDDEMVQVAINACNSYQDSLVRSDSRFDKAVKAEEWLKDLKSRVLPQPKQEWSKEDEENFARVDYACLKVYGGDSYSSDWLRKILGIHKKWKPSDEQMDWLIWVINRMPDTEKANEAEAVLRDLLEHLNKLRG